MRLLKPFGEGGLSHRSGYDLPLLVGHMESLVSDEAENIDTWSGRKAKRLEMVEKAIQLLNEAMDMGGEGR
jgi:hypothetical protein